MNSKKDKEKHIFHQAFDKQLSVDEALDLWNQNMSDDIDLTHSFLTMWDENTKHLSFLKGAL